VSRLSPGDVFAGYTIERELGAGGMGEVYLARHPRLPRHDALKVLAAHLSEDPKYRARFEREADVVAALRHPSIVGVHDRGESEGRLWIAFEYIEGHDLTRHVSDDPLPPTEVTRIIAQVADALDAAARRGLTHRDVKPANILLDEDGRAQLADFGIAYPGDGVTKLTGTGIALGTVAFAAPEQLQGRAVDARADQYALACTSFALLTGTNVYMGTSVAAIAVSHVRDPIPMAADRAPGRITPAVDTVLTRALAKNRDDRYPDSRGFAAALAEAVATPAPAPGATAAKMAAQTLIPPTNTPQPGTPQQGTQQPGTPQPGTAPPGRPPAPEPPRATTRKDPRVVQQLPYPQSKLLSGQPKARPEQDPTTTRFNRTSPTEDLAPPTKRFASPYQAAQPTAPRGAYQGPTPPEPPQPRPPRPGSAQPPTARRSAPAGTPPAPRTRVSTTRPEPHRAQSLSGDLASPRSGPAAMPPPVERGGLRRRGPLIGALVLVAVLVVCIAAWVLTSDDDPSGTSTTVNLKTARTEPLWTWNPKVLSDNYQEDLGIVGGTPAYAVAVSKIDSGATILSILDTADGKTERTLTLSDKTITITRCQQLGDAKSSTVACWGSDTGNPQPYIVDLTKGTVNKADAEGTAFAVTGPDYILVSSNGVYSGSAKGKNFSQSGVRTRSVYPPVNGSPVINLVDDAGNITLRQIAAGDTIYAFSDDNTDELWLPFRNGFVIRKTGSDSSVAPQFTFYDGTGNITAELSGQWTLPSLPTDSAIPADVPPVPVLVNTDDRLIAAFDPESGKKLWEKSYQSRSVTSVQGLGDTIVLTSSANEFEWFNASDGSGGPIYVPPKGGQAGSPLGGDGSSFAMLSQPAYGGAGSQELMVFGKDKSSPTWQMRVPSTGQYPGAPVIAGGKVYAGGGLKFGDRRIL
jgi:serine/threonine-protein kinase